MEKWLKVILIILVVLIAFFINREQEKWKENNCELTFNTYTYNIGCASACSTKCYDSGFSQVDVGYFYPYLSAEDMNNAELYKRCECECGGM